MLTRVVPGLRVINAAARQQVVRCMGGHAPAHWKTDKEIALANQAHMNSFPVPEGPWQEYHDRRNSKWNMQLGAAALVFVATIVAMNQYECLYLHGTPPLKKN